jgi:DNA mismatch repair ATPase MutS
MKHDDIDIKDPIVDLFYPTKEKRYAMKKRRAELENLPQDYIANLELEKIAELICPHFQYRIIRMFSEMCDDPEIIAYRCDILEDFLNIPTLSTTIHKVINIMLEGDRRSIYELNEPDSFYKLNCSIESFDAFVECIDVMHNFYEKKRSEIHSEGVHRLFACFEEHYSDKHFNKLKDELNELKSAMKNRIRSVTVAINFDEFLMPISAGIVEYSKDAYTLKPSLFDRILYYGGKTSDKNIVKNLKSKFEDNDVGEDKLINTSDRALFEGLESVTNDYVEKIRKIMSEYQKVGFEEVYSLDYQLEYYLGAVKLIETCRSSGVGMCRPKILPMSERKASFKGIYDLIYFSESRLWNYRHKGSKEQKSVVTNDIAFDEQVGFYILTGANNGGKTTFIRAIGICQALAQIGLYVPCESCEISLADYIYTHFPKEEQTGINTSRFTTEIKEFKTISDTITNHSLLIMNESIQSTTPQECIDISAELVHIFCRIGVRGIFATHLLDLAKKAEKFNDDSDTHTKIASIVVEVDDKTGERLYKIKRGYPSETSYAGAIFEQFGINAEDIAKRIEKMTF